MEKEFVTYELALRLKLLGFNEPCFAFHSKIYGLLHTSPTQKVNEISGEVLAPTWQSAFKWFRDTYEIDGFVQVEPLNEKYGFVVYNRKIQNYTESNRKMTIEEAELTCLEKLCEIVEQQVK
jgi:hypothetical protein